MALRLGLGPILRLRAQLQGVLGHRRCFQHHSGKSRSSVNGSKRLEFRPPNDEEIQLLELLCKGIYALSKSRLKLLVSFCSARDEVQIPLGRGHDSKENSQTSNSTSPTKWSVSPSTASVTSKG